MLPVVNVVDAFLIGAAFGWLCTRGGSKEVAMERLSLLAVPLLLMALALMLAPMPAAAQPSNEAPDEIRIEAIKVLAYIQPLPIINGAMSPPTRLDAVGWYEASPKLGINGNVLMTGYYFWDGLPSTFGRLSELQAGDEIIVWSQSGRLYTYAVSWVRQVPKAGAPLGELVGPTDNQSLTLITDAGKWNGQIFEDSTIVRAVRTNL